MKKIFILKLLCNSINLHSITQISPPAAPGKSSMKQSTTKKPPMNKKKPLPPKAPSAAELLDKQNIADLKQEVSDLQSQDNAIQLNNQAAQKQIEILAEQILEEKNIDKTQENKAKMITLISGGIIILALSGILMYKNADSIKANFKKITDYVSKKLGWGEKEENVKDEDNERIDKNEDLPPVTEEKDYTKWRDTKLLPEAKKIFEEYKKSKETFIQETDLKKNATNDKNIATITKAKNIADFVNGGYEESYTDNVFLSEIIKILQDKNNIKSTQPLNIPDTAEVFGKLDNVTEKLIKEEKAKYSPDKVVKKLNEYHETLNTHKDIQDNMFNKHEPTKEFLENFEKYNPEFKKENIQFNSKKNAFELKAE